MKKLVREFEFSPEQLHEVETLANAFSLSPVTAGILYARGVDSEEKLRAFLEPSERNYLSPFLMKGMKEAVELITRAKEEEWRVAVFGDYDADGIGASAILSRALKRFGIEPYLFVPERIEGYGLSVRALDGIFDDFLPDLVITVDCGISNREEVEYIKEQGAFAIVTDHHELPDVLPDCIVINPKLKDEYPYDNLCGAGVAFKLAQALIGEEAYALADFAALSTVADSVPLLGENRDIVAEGLRRINESPRPAFSALLGKTAEVTAQTLSFTAAPRINAAGRMGDARAALTLFTSEDEEEIAELAARLNTYNAERQKLCDEVYEQARAQLAEEGAFGNVVMLVGEGWNAGFVGIVAARIAEEFARPALLFVKRGGQLKGSARSIENVNIFEALKSCSEHIEEFGGHAQAAGVNVSAAEFEALKGALDAYIGSHYTREDFTPTVAVAGEAASDYRTVARELTLLEPCGMGNRRPLFVAEAGAVRVQPLKAGSPHLSLELGGMEFVYFGGVRDLDILKSDVKKQIVFEYNLSHFRGKEYIKGFVRCVLYDGMSGEDVALDAFERQLLLTPARGTPLSEEELCALVEARMKACAYGLCAVVSKRETLARFPALKTLGVELFRPASGGGNTVLYAPDADCSLSAYREVVCLDSPALLPEDTGNATVFTCASSSDMGAFEYVSCVREDLLSLFARLKKFDGAEVGDSYAEAARRLNFGDTAKEQVVFALAVFSELGLVRLTQGVLTFVRGVKTDLNNSAIYRMVSQMKEGA